MRIPLFSAALLLTGCVIQAPPREVPVPEPAPVAEEYPADAPVTSIQEEPPIEQPAPVAVGWAPPPMLVEAPPPMPFDSAVWVGGYWVWRGNWVWAHGYWMAPPRPAYVWVHPYYEHRGDAVIFIDGHWSPPGVAFMPPPRGMRLVVEAPAMGVIPGPRPIGPEGCFVPPPPGSRRGIIVPAPIGTAPAVVTSAPPVVAVGMRVTNNITNIHSTNITQVTNVTNVTIVAPPNAMANGRAFNTQVPAAPHLAAARPALVQARAPAPNSARPLSPYAAPAPAEATPGHPNPPPVQAPMLGHEPAPVRGGGPSPPRPLTAYASPPQVQNPGVAPRAPVAVRQPPAPASAGTAHPPPKVNPAPPQHGNAAVANPNAHGNAPNAANAAKPAKPDADNHAKKPDHEGKGQEH